MIAPERLSPYAETAGEPPVCSSACPRNGCSFVGVFARRFGVVALVCILRMQWRYRFAGVSAPGCCEDVTLLLMGLVDLERPVLPLRDVKLEVLPRPLVFQPAF